MIELKQVLSSFTTEKQQQFVLYLDKKNKRKDTKNIQLTKLLLLDNYSSKEISEKIYGKQNKVALHALRKRLFNAIIDFTADASMKTENSIDVKLIKYILSARSFLEKNQIRIGYQILDKAETIAKEHQFFTILNEIYHTKIQYSYTNTSQNLEKLIIDFKKNQQNYMLEERLNIVYAKIRTSLNEFQHNKSKIDIKKLINNTLKEQKILNYNDLSFKSLYQMIQITNISSFQKFDYYNIESFIISTYQIVKNHTSKEKQIYYHIEILYVIANVLFRNKKFDESLYYLNLMRIYMSSNKKKYYNHFVAKYHLLTALNYNYSQNQDKAIQFLEIYINNKHIEITTQLDIYLTLIVFYYQKGALKLAQQLFSKFYHTDQWYIKKAGIIWSIKKSLIDILLQIDLGNINLVDSRLKSFKRNYYKHLRGINQEKVITYLQLVESYYKSPEIASTKAFIEKVEVSFDWIDKEKEDIFMMSFFAWLKAKMTKQNLYMVTLDLINY